MLEVRKALGGGGLFEDWVSSRPVLKNGWYLADVYTNFPVELSSLDEMECPLNKCPLTYTVDRL